MKSDMNKRDSKFIETKSDKNEIRIILSQMMGQKPNSSPVNMNFPKAQYPYTVVLDNNKSF